MIIFFGTDDPWKPGSDRVREKLKSLGGTRNELWLAKGQHHGFFNKRPWLDLTLAEADRFLADLGLLHGATGLAFPPNSPLLERAP